MDTPGRVGYGVFMCDLAIVPAKYKGPSVYDEACERRSIRQAVCELTIRR